MQINYVLLVSRQGKVRLAKWFTTMSPKAKSKIVKDVTQLVLARRTRMCNFLEYKGEPRPSGCAWDSDLRRSLRRRYQGRLPALRLPFLRHGDWRFG